MTDDQGIYELRRQLLAEWLVEYGGTKQDFAARIGVSPSYLTRLLSRSEQKGHKNIDTDIAQRIELALDRDGQMLNPQIRELRTQIDGGGAEEAPNTTPNPRSTPGVKSGPIDQLPLLSWGMIDRIGMPNKEIQGMAFVKLGFASGHWDADIDKIVQVPDMALAPRFEMGDYLVMHPVVPGETIAPGRLPVLVRMPDGAHALTTYNALQVALNNLTVVAVCRQFFSPPI